MKEKKRYEIGPGIGLTVVPTTRFKLSYMSANFVLPLARETAGFGALLPEVLAAGGTRGRAALEAELEELYGAILSSGVRKKGECQIASLGLRFPESRYTGDETQLARSVELLCGLLLNSSFSEEQVETEKKNLVDRIEAKLNDKRGYAIDRCVETMCADEAYGVPELGERTQVERITAAELTDFYRKVQKTVPVELFFIGSTDADELAQKLRTAFASVQRELRTFPVTEVRPAGKTKEKEEALPVNQGRLTLGFRTGITVRDARYPALLLFNAIYGGTASSKLFLNVRERLSLCYDVSSIQEKVKGIMLVASGIQPADRARAQSEILAQLEAMREGAFTEEEIREAVTIVTNALRSAEDATTLIEDGELTRLLAGGGLDTGALIDALGKVKKEEIVAVARTVALDTVYFLNSSEVKR